MGGTQLDDKGDTRGDPEETGRHLLQRRGAGLLGGVLEGCKAVGWEDVPIVALGTIGSDCFYHSMSMNNGRFNAKERKLPDNVDLVHDKETGLYLAHFRAFSSKASGSLGASVPAEGIVKMALEWPGGVKCISVPDGLSMETLGLFADDQKMLVELACSTTLVPAYNPALFNKIVDSTDEERTVVFIVCGGFKMSLAEATEYRRMVEAEPHETWTVKYDDGSLFTFPKQSRIH
ncbi:hypothetical protein NMY22_g1263 [Coprinellus aureogranulatus]|nr:hypothetical protein NMY22_g1263 [Coprinellus aureogranulatus]